jgi:hypothetical protein
MHTIRLAAAGGFALDEIAGAGVAGAEVAAAGPDAAPVADAFRVAHPAVPATVTVAVTRRAASSGPYPTCLIQLLPGSVGRHTVGRPRSDPDARRIDDAAIEPKDPTRGLCRQSP